MSTVLLEAPPDTGSTTAEDDHREHEMEVRCRRTMAYRVYRIHGEAIEACSEGSEVEDGRIPELSLWCSDCGVQLDWPASRVVFA